MSIDIDFTVAPPALANISEQREQAVNERAVYRKRNIRFHCTMAAITALYLTFLIVVVIPMIAQASPDWGMVTYFFPYFTLAIFVVGNHLHIKRIEKPSKLLDKTIEGLTEGEEDEINPVINDNDQPEEIAAYIKQVSNQGRLLINIEIEEIQKWHDEKKRTAEGNTGKLNNCPYSI